VHVAEASGDGEVRADRSEGVVDGEDILGLGVEGVVVDVFVVDAVFFTAGDTDFLHLLALVNRPGRKGRGTISSHCFMGAARFKYLAVVSMFQSTGSSDKSIMWEENRGSPCCLK
jgi:hypothetical protein